MSARISIYALTLSAAAFGALVVKESYTEEAVIPVRGDVPTVGFGMTKRPDGSPVQMGDRTNPVEAVQRSLQHIARDESGIKRCITSPLSQAEYDLMVGFAYQYGVPTLCKSSMVREVNAGNYAASCQAYGKYRFVAGRDCALPGSGCRGVALRAQARVDACMAAQ